MVSVENELLELEEVEKEQKTLIEEYKTQVTIAFILMFAKFGRQFKTLHLFMIYINRIKERWSYYFVREYDMSQLFLRVPNTFINR